MSDFAYSTVIHTFYFFAMMAFSLLITSIMYRFVKTLGTKNQPGAMVRWSADTKPAIGGLTFFILFLISFCAYAFIVDALEVFDSPRIVSLIAASTTGFLMGLTDDAYNTRPLLKFSIQILCGVILVIGDTTIHFFESAELNAALTILWTVGIMNSINMLDNMDGITGSVTVFIVISALASHTVLAYMPGADTFILLGILAALLGFLFYNWHPSSIYMGDTGSQFLGVVLAYIGVHYCWNVETLLSENGNLLGIAALLCVFVLPIADTTVVTINRLRRGQSPFVGGRDHTTHNLSYHGLKDNQVALVFSAISAASTLLYLFMLQNISRDDTSILLVYIAYFVAVFLVLFIIAEKNKARWMIIPVQQKAPKKKTRKQKTA
jgi:UDP-GlcNAc:undecaprenyl-phosphate GlcNAc-1-phosphate transferase